MRNTLKFSIFIILISVKSFAIGEYNKGDVLYNWKNAVVNIRQKPNIKSDIITTVHFGDRCIVVDDSLKINKFSVLEIKATTKYEVNEMRYFKGYTIIGFWVQVQINSGEIGYVFDGYLSKLNPNFELTETYFNSKFKLTKSTNKKFPESIADNAYSKTRFYKNGSYIIQNGSNYDAHEHYFIPNISLEEGYWLVLKTNPNVLELHKSSGDDETGYYYKPTELSFVTSMEAISVTKITYKGLKGVELLFEGWD